MAAQREEIAPAQPKNALGGITHIKDMVFPFNEDHYSFSSEAKRHVNGLKDVKNKIEGKKQVIIRSGTGYNFRVFRKRKKPLGFFEKCKRPCDEPDGYVIV